MSKIHTTDELVRVTIKIIKVPIITLTWTGSRILDVILLPDSASSWISSSSQLVVVARIAPADSACSAAANLPISTWERIKESKNHLSI